MSARDVIEKTMEDWWASIPDQQTGADAILSALSKEPTDDQLYKAFYVPETAAGEDVQSLWKRRYKAMLTAAKGE